MWNPRGIEQLAMDKGAGKRKGTESVRHQECDYFRFSCQVNYFSNVAEPLAFKKL